MNHVVPPLQIYVPCPFCHGTGLDGYHAFLRGWDVCRTFNACGYCDGSMVEWRASDTTDEAAAVAVSGGAN